MRPESAVARGELCQLEVIESRRVDRNGSSGGAYKYDLLGVGSGGREQQQGQ
jgi:hypothetical protein